MFRGILSFVDLCGVDLFLMVPERPVAGKQINTGHGGPIQEEKEARVDEHAANPGDDLALVCGN